MARIVNNSWVAATPPTGKTITGYSLENNGVVIATLGNVLVDNNRTINDDLEINTRIRAIYNDATNGLYSNVETIAVAGAPNAPTVLADAGSESTPSTEINLTWVKSTTGVMTNYRVYFGGVLQQTFGDVALGTLTGLTAATAYNTITVRAWDGTNESADSNSINVTTEAATTEVILFDTDRAGDDLTDLTFTGTTTATYNNGRIQILAGTGASSDVNAGILASLFTPSGNFVVGNTYRFIADVFAKDALYTLYGSSYPNPTPSDQVAIVGENSIDNIGISAGSFKFTFTRESGSNWANEIVEVSRFRIIDLGII